MKIKCLQEVIDIIRNKPNFTKLLTYKYEGFKLKPDTETLVLGSSHLANGYTPKGKEYNFSMPSQDLYYAYNLYKYLNNPNIKNVIVAISVFTPGLSIVKTKCSDFCVPYKVLFGIDYQDENSAKEKNLYSKEEACKGEILKYQKNLRLPKNYLGNLLKYPHAKFNAEKAEVRALKHYKNNQREVSQMNFCENFIKDTINNNQKLFFVLPPTTESYRKSLPQREEVFRVLYNLCLSYNHVRVLNYYDTDLFNIKEFSNEDHLNKKGADKLSEFIREDMKNA